MNSVCVWCLMEAEMNGGPKATLDGRAAIDCVKHRDNPAAAAAIFNPQTKGQTMAKQRIKSAVCAAVVVAVIGSLFLCGCELLAKEKKVTVTLADGKKIKVRQGELDPAKTEPIEALGELFGPVGGAIAKCGVAIVALAMAESNRRKIKKLKEAHAK